MEPDVRYCTTSDGVRIAYTVTGEGAPEPVRHLLAGKGSTFADRGEFPEGLDDAVRLYEARWREDA